MYWRPSTREKAVQDPPPPRRITVARGGKVGETSIWMVSAENRCLGFRMNMTIERSRSMLWRTRRERLDGGDQLGLENVMNPGNLFGGWRDDWRSHGNGYYSRCILSRRLGCDFVNRTSFILWARTDSRIPHRPQMLEDAGTNRGEI